MTEAKIVAAIKNYVTSHRGVTGFPLRDQQVADEVDTLRMRMINELDQKRLFRKPYQGFVQRIEFTVPNTKKITLPKVYFQLDGTPAIEYIGGKQFNTLYRVFTGVNHNAWSIDDEWTLPAVTVDGQEFTFHNFGSNELVLIAVFEDPSSPFGYDGGYDEEEGDEYPIPSAMKDIIIGKTAESYLRTMYRIFPQANKQVDVPPQPQ
jgi:hypothetical protein